ncbi:Trp biosynthesis-associated membrane protein [Saccharomonospora azurea]|uniref:Tryptophan-associated transmembrane protein (Trp_oprn_chp) n=1 Tax=Saccharomonospora azurea NA-128 TaxID=882081 RepID=H8G8P7_9PSEU|nr:Trp biosynthesis-associated membrane protein [Saccharomonospora azurea]EHK89151.1 Tryptophan-associated transmembrane protein (Trp_oprn_chp) [Saccharomonospora azurea SZMC 14600]EHY88456.1 Tryptophan-associated transmembrane protein (Trp_oprn_chp) [Saccharomonospora azurea NA-128]
MPDSAKRPLWIALAALASAALALWGASSLTWVDVPAGTVFHGELREEISGSDLVTWPVPLALLALAAMAATLALRGVARRVLGIVLVAVAVWVTVLVLDGSAYDVDLSTRAPGYDAMPGEPTKTWLGPGAALVAAALYAFAGAVLAWRGHRMPRMGAKYSAPGEQKERRRSGNPDADLWNALSEGEDPTTRDR